jgi:branched-chain amino acid aminotransferase
VPSAIAELASVDGVVSPASEAQISVTDEGLLRGDGVFEVVRLYAGRPFALSDHLDRLERSAAAIELPLERKAISSEIDALLSKSEGQEGQLRIVITRGERRILLIEQLPAAGATISLATVTYSPSVILTGAKTLSYAANMEATRIAHAKGADEAVLIRPDGVVLEAPTSSIFWATAEGRLCTPSIEAGVLESITRARVVHALEVEEGSFDADQLRGAHEAFLASTTREVQPVAAVDRKELPETPGPRTREAIEAFAGVLEQEL